MNEIIRAIEERSSTRGFTPEQLTEEELKVIENAALASPTAVNRQEWCFPFVGKDMIAEVEKAQLELSLKNADEETRKRLESRNMKVLYNAPLMVVISVDKNFGWSKVDAGIAVENIALAAQGLGLGSVIIGCIGAIFESEKKDYFEKLLKFPENYEFAVAIVLGHKAVEKTPHEKKPEKIIRLF